MRRIILIMGFLVFLLFLGKNDSLAQCIDTSIVGNSLCAPASIILKLCDGLEADWTITGGNASTPTFSGFQFINTFYDGTTYTITAVVKGTQVTRTMQITIHGKPIPCFTIGPKNGCAPLKVCLNTDCTHGGQPPYKIAWDLQNGIITHTGDTCAYYEFTGPHAFVLKIKDKFGCETDTILKKDSIHVYPVPVPCFSTQGSAANCAAPFPVCFSNCSTPSTGLTYSWILTGATPSGSAVTAPCVTYTAGGSYDVKLTATSAQGCTASHNEIAYINIGNNTTSFTFGTKDSICTGESISANAANADSYTWSSSPGVTFNPDNSPNTVITFPAAGTYPIKLTVTLPGGCTATQTKNVYVFDAPQPSFSYSPLNAAACQPPLTLTLANTTPNRNNWTYAWDFGGGTPSVNPPPLNGLFQVTFKDCGGYNVSLTATNKAGCAATFTPPKTIADINCLQGIITVDTLKPAPPVCIPYTPKIRLHTSGKDLIYSWDFNYKAPGNFPAGIKNDSVVSHTYTIEGCYIVAVKITNSLGCSAIIIAKDAICPGAYLTDTLDFKATPDSACATQQITFSVKKQATLNNCTTMYQWFFGDGGRTGRIPPPGAASHQYTDTGCFTVSMVRCNCECCDTITKKFIVCIWPPIVEMNLTRTCQDPLSIVCSTTGSLGVDSVAWEIPPDGVITQSTIEQVHGRNVITGITVHFPNSNTSYNICATGFNIARKCSSQVCRVAQTIEPIPKFFFKKNVICLSDTAFVIDSSKGLNSYSWTLKDELGNTILTSNLRCFPFGICPGAYNFDKPGKYCLTLCGRDVGGCPGRCDTQCITVNGLIPDFTANQVAGCSPFPVSFTDITQNNSLSTYKFSHWDFGDPLSGPKNQATGKLANHIYIFPKQYDVTLCDSDNHHCYSCTTKTQFISVLKPFLRIKLLDTTACAGGKICAINDSIESGTTYKWYLVDPKGNIVDSATSNSPCFNLPDSGKYIIVLRGTNSSGCSDTLRRPISAGKVTAGLSADKTYISCPPLEVHFMNLSFGDTLGLTYLWRFGAGGPNSNNDSSSLKNPAYTYLRAGCNTVSLTITNAKGCSNTVTLKDYICLGGPTATVTIRPDSGCIPLSVLFTAKPTTSQNFVWCSGDSCTSLTTADNARFLYKRPGIKSPTVTLFDGTCRYDYPIDKVYVDSLDALFSISTQNICSAGTIDLVDTSFAVLGNMFGDISCLWRFGDGKTSVNCSTSHSYATTQTVDTTYNLTLIATTKTGCKDSLTKVVMVHPSPVADAIIDKPIICPGDSVCFTFNSTAPTSFIDSVHWDFGDGGTSTKQSPCHIYISGGYYKVILFVRAKNGCTDTAQYHIKVNSPNIDAGKDTAVCLQDSIMLKATGGVSYHWTPPGGLSDTLIATPFASPTVVTTYTVVVTDNQGCSGKDSVIVNVHPHPVPGITFEDSVCSGQPDTITATGGIKYLWSTGEKTAIIYAVPTVNTTYTVTITDNNKCTADTTAPVTALPLPNIHTNSDTSVCKGDTINLHSDGGVKYFWTSDGIIIGSPDSPNIRGLINDTSIYTVKVTDSLSCYSIAQIKVTMLPLPNVNAGPDEIVCSGTSVQLHGTGALKYLWSPQQLFITKNNIPNPIAFPDSSSHIQLVQTILKGTDANTCSNYDTVNLKILYPFKAQFIPDTCICFRECAHLYVIADTPKTYRWSPAIAIDDAYIARPIVCPVTDEIYQVIVSDGQCYADTGAVKICVNQLPEVTAGNDTLILAGGLATLTANSTSAGNYVWLPDTLLNCAYDDCHIAYAHPDYKTIYVVTLTDENGCRDEDTSIVYVFCSNASIYIPNAFSPNGDGKNDIYYLKGTGFILKDFRIYNRWGEIVFETHDIAQGWDGRFNGQLYGPNVFVYQLDAICSTGEVISKKGNITLVR